MKGNAPNGKSFVDRIVNNLVKQTNEMPRNSNQSCKLLRRLSFINYDNFIIYLIDRMWKTKVV